MPIPEADAPRAMEPAATRINAWIARTGVASRRAAERMILDGRIAINGQAIADLATRVGPEDEVTLDGKRIEAESVTRYVVLNKPRGYVASMSDPEGRPLAAALIQARYPERLYNIGRLDQWSQGLLLFTNDGDFAAKVGHPSSGIEKEYEVRSGQDIPRQLLAEFERGLVAEGVRYQAEKARLIAPRVARIVLVEGKNREIRRVFESRMVHVESLTRVRIGPVLMGDMEEGAFRELTPDEIAGLCPPAKD
ncbi:MAG: pseudouridine synthase [Rectinemataceae bacterium]